jgi:tetratricopeptide (TPR) repeat protein
LGWCTLALLVAVVLCAPAPPAQAAPQQDPTNAVQLQASPQLFATVGALFAAGFDRDPNTLSSDALVTKFRALHGPATDALRDYMKARASSDPTLDISRYVTFALLVGAPPKFDMAVRRDDLPPDVLELDGFRDVLAKFYAEANMDALWREYQSRYQEGQVQLRDPLQRAVLTSSGYLREFATPGRRFNVYVEPLVGGQIHVRNVGAEYSLVVNPAVGSFEEIRHAYLHFMLDPLVIRYRNQLLPLDVLYRIALRAPRLQESLRKDSLAYFAECLVHAVELRVQELPQAKLAAEVDTADQDGLVIVRMLMPALAKFESSEPGMSYYFPDLLKSLDVTDERARLQNMRFPPVETLEPVAAPQISDLDRAVQEGDRLSAARDADGAMAAYERALSLNPNDSRALYGTAVVSLMQGQGEKAFALFQQVVAAASGTDPASRPDAASLSWAHVYLGRLHDLASERDEAISEYRSALAVQGAPDAARAAAQKGVNEAYQPAARNPPPG